jgi:hypothetical protein
MHGYAVSLMGLACGGFIGATLSDGLTTKRWCPTRLVFSIAGMAGVILQSFS